MSAEHEYNQQTLIMIRYACFMYACNYIYIHIYILLYIYIYILLYMCVFYECEEDTMKKRKEFRHAFMIGIMRLSFR